MKDTDPTYPIPSHPIHNLEEPSQMMPSLIARPRECVPGFCILNKPPSSLLPSTLFDKNYQYEALTKTSERDLGLKYI